MIIGYIMVCFLASLCVYLVTVKAWLSMVVLSALLLPMVWPDKKSRFSLLAIGATLLFVQLWIFANLGNATWLAFSATWVALSHFIITKCGRALGVTSAFCVFSALSYLFGRVSGADFSAFSTGLPYLFAANIFAIIAILYAGWRGGVVSWDNRNNSRGWGLANSFSLWSRYPDSYPISAKEKAQKVKVPE